MKQSEIQEIITATPDAVFSSNVKYTGCFIIKGFTKHARSKYATPTVYAVTQELYFNAATGTTRLGSEERTPLRHVTGIFCDSVADYTASKIESAKRTAAARQRTQEQAELMTDLMPELREALKQAGVDNKAFNYGLGNTTFKIEVDVDNAEQLLQILRTFHTANA